VVITRPNDIVNVYRATAVDGNGDTTDDNSTAVIEGLEMSIIQTGKKVSRYDSQKPRIVRDYEGRAEGLTDLRKGDRLNSQITSKWFIVDAVTQPENIDGRIPDLCVQLRAQANNP
jgi:hypothetical protein